MKTRRPGIVKWLLGLQMFGLVTIFVYWGLYFGAPTTVQVRPNDPVYIGYEDAFVLCDLWILVATVLGITGIVKRRSWGGLFTLLGASSVAFLGLIDLLFDLQQGIFVPFNMDALGEAFLVFYCLTTSPFAVWVTWKHRETLLVDG